MDALPHTDMAIAVPEWDAAFDHLTAIGDDYWMWTDVEEALRGQLGFVPAHEFDDAILYGKMSGRIVNEMHATGAARWRVVGS